MSGNSYTNHYNSVCWDCIQHLPYFKHFVLSPCILPLGVMLEIWQRVNECRKLLFSSFFKCIGLQFQLFIARCRHTIFVSWSYILSLVKTRELCIVLRNVLYSCNHCEQNQLTWFLANIFFFFSHRSKTSSPELEW